MKITYKKLQEPEITFQLFENFDRFQKVSKCWRKENNEWILKEIAFVDDWNNDEKNYLVDCLRNTIKTGGCVIAALNDQSLVGFSSIESERFGSENQYLQLSSLHVSNQYRGQGSGKELFKYICSEAKRLGATKLYISSHSSEDTQAFYKKMGCVDAIEINEKIAEQEPFDRQLEYSLN